MFTSALGLRFVGENHFADRFTTGDRGVEDGHGNLRLFEY